MTEKQKEHQHHFSFASSFEVIKLHTEQEAQVQLCFQKVYDGQNIAINNQSEESVESDDIKNEWRPVRSL